MKGLFIIILSLSILGITAITSHSAQYWAKTYGGSGCDEARSIWQTVDGGYIVAGRTESFGVAGKDVWVLKLDSSGNVVWQKTYGGINSDVAYSIQQTTDDGYIILGQTESFGAGNADIWVIKLDNSGEITWQKTYGGNLWDRPRSIQQTSDGGYIVAGYTESFGAGGYDLWVLNLESNGDISWQKTYGGSGYDKAYSIQETSDGQYIVAGSTSSFGSSAVWILKLEINGDIYWQKIYSDLSYAAHWASSIQQTTDGGYIVACNYETSGLDVSPWILKLDSNGNISWQKIDWSSPGRYTYSIQQTMEEGYIMVGNTVTTHWGNMWVLKLDSDGNGSWEKGGVGSFPSYAYSFLQTMDGGYIVTGMTHDIDGGTHDTLVLKLDSNGDVPDCDIIYTDPDPPLYTFSASVQDTTITFQPTSATITETNIIPQDSSAVITTICGGGFELCLLERIYGEYSEEIKLIRYFRDNVLSKTTEGKEIIKLYYEWSPAIVKAIEDDEEFKKEVKETIDGIMLLIE